MILDAESRFRENLNFAFLSDRLMAEAMMFVEGGVATPSTLFATNSLIQAVVLHDSVIAGLVEMTGAIHPVASETLRSKLGEGIAPKVNLPELSGVSNDLTFNVWHWLCPEFVIATHSSDGDVKSLSALTDVLAVSKIAEIVIDDDMFEEKFGVSVRFRTASVADDIAFEIFQNKLKSIGLGRMSPTDLAAIRDQAGLVAAGVTIAKHVGKDFYHALHERPLVAGEMRSHGPRRMIELMEGELYNDVSIGLEDLEIPPFLGMLISETDDWPSRFWERLLDLRERHKKFRLNIGKYQINWRNSTRGDQRKLKLEFDRAWSSLLKKEEHVLETRVSHVTLNALLSVGKSLAKDAIALDKFDQPISRVGGLVTLWNDMESIVPAHRGREIISKHCVDIASPAQWSEILSNVSSANSAAALSKDAN